MIKWQYTLLLILIILMAVPCMAVDYEFSYSYEIPKENIGFSDTDDCTGHVYFEQFSVNQNQWVAVYYRYSEANEEDAGAFSRVYIDVYNAEGSLEKEISFDTSQEIAIELTENAVLIYFHTHVMAYTWEDNAICGYQITDYDSVRQDIFNELRKTTRSVGEWTYTSKKELQGYTKLTRENGEITQTILELPGSRFNVWNTVLPGVLCGIVMLAAVIVKRARSSAKQKKDAA